MSPDNLQLSPAPAASESGSARRRARVCVHVCNAHTHSAGRRSLCLHDLTFVSHSVSSQPCPASSFLSVCWSKPLERRARVCTSVCVLEKIICSHFLPPHLLMFSSLLLSTNCTKQQKGNPTFRSGVFFLLLLLSVTRTGSRKKKKK